MFYCLRRKIYYEHYCMALLSYFKPAVFEIDTPDYLK